MNYCSKYMQIKHTFEVVYHGFLVGRQEVSADVVVVRLPCSRCRPKLPVPPFPQDFPRLNKILKQRVFR